MIDTALARLEGWLIVLFLWLMVIFAFMQVLLRGLYPHGHFQWANSLMGLMDWSEPMVRLLVLWLTFLGASLITGENKHIKIDLFSTFLPQKWQIVRELVLSLACVIVTSIMLRVSISYIQLEMEFGGNTFLGLPSWIGQLILPIGFALIFFRFLLRTIENGLQIARGREV